MSWSRVGHDSDDGKDSRLESTHNRALPVQDQGVRGQEYVLFPRRV